MNLMMNDTLSVRPLVEPGFFRKLLKKPAPENGYIELENLLASRRWVELHEGHVAEALQKHGVKSLNRTRSNELYRKAIQTFIADDELSDEEVADLQRLRTLLGVRPADAEEIEREIVTTRYKCEIDAVLADERVTEEERQRLERLKKSLRLDEKLALSLWEKKAEPIVQRRWQEAVNDRRLTTEEQKALEALAKNLGVQVEIDSATQANLDRFRWYALMESGRFPEVPVSIALQKKETCHFMGPTTLFEMRTETQRVNYGGTTARIKIMKGVYYRVGSVNVQRITREVLKQIDTGTLYVTNKRIIFDGSRKNSTIRLSGVFSISPYSDAVEIEKSSGRNPYFAVADPEWLSVLLSSLLNYQND